MAWNLSASDFEFRHPDYGSEKRISVLMLLLASGIGAALAIILEKPFEGQIPSVTILGLLEIILASALLRAGLHRWQQQRSIRAEGPSAPQQEAFAHQLLREHIAYRAVFKTLVAGAGIEQVLSSVADAAESILPGCCCCFMERSPTNGQMRALPRLDSDSACRALALPMSPQNARMFGQISREMPELVIHNPIEVFDEQTAGLLQARGLSCCHLQAIFLGNSELWGILSLWYPPDIAETVRSEAGVLVQLATAAIDRGLLIRHLEDKTKRSLLAEKAGKIGIWDWDLKTNSAIWSEQMEALYLMNSGASDGRHESWRRLVVPEDLIQIEAHLQECFREKSRDYHGTYRVKLSDGQIHWMESLAAIYYDESNSPVRMVGTTQDITKDKELLGRTEEAKRRLELVLEAAKLGFWDWHLPSGHGEFGGSWASMLGYSAEDVDPNVRSWETLVHPDDAPRVFQELRRHLSGETPLYECEHRLRKKDGSWLWVLDRGRVVERDSQGRPIRAFGIHADVSEQRAVQDALKLAAKRKDEFLATLAHELRNPLAPIRTGLQILKRSSSDAERQRARDMMDRQLQQMVRLIDDLLDVARITQGRIELKKSLISLQDAVEAGIEGAKPLIDAAGQSLTVEMPKAPIRLSGDLVRLAQVVNNIVSNAAKYTPQAGSINVRVSRSNGTASMTVTDNGIGIPKEMLESVFDMFGQVNQALDRSQGGLGIGLAIVRKLVEMHGGDVRAESQGAGLGSTFTVHLPALVESPQSEANAQASAVWRDCSLRKRVLVVDDNKDGAESLALFISLLGHEVMVAHSGAEALEKVQGAMPDTIFLDIGLPGMNGYEVAREIRAMPGAATVKLVALTGWGTDEDKRKALEAGFSEHLTKPVDLTHIERVLEHSATIEPSPQGESNQLAGQSP